MLLPEEYEEFHRIVRANDCLPDDFEVSTTDNFEKSEKYHVEITEISIRYILNNVTIKYLSGFGSYWLLKFEQDLKGGQYK